MKKDLCDGTENADRDSDRGASLVEYALLVALIAIVAIAGLRTLGRAVNSRFSNLGSTLTVTN
jgi:pilus assembly protein Flp/PilA